MKVAHVFSNRPCPLHQLNLQEALEEAKKVRPRVYRTRVRLGKERMSGIPATGDFIFTTTSKDLHLSLGWRGLEVQCRLIEFLEEEFSDDQELLLVFDEKESVLVTRTDALNQVTYTMSPAH